MTQVQWFPGHMAKAIRLIEETIHTVDFVIECRDARAPFSTRNPVLARATHQKKVLVLLTKRDLATKDSVLKWEEKLKEEGAEVLTVDVLKDPIKPLILEKTKIIMHDKHERDKRRGIRSRTPRAMIVGVPNVGKSTVINQLASKRSAKVENRPGVTQSLKLIKVGKDLEVVDTPGVLWPKFENEEMGIKCALVGSIKETGYPLQLVSDYGLENMNSSNLKSHYNLEKSETFFEDLALSKGFLFKGGTLDIETARRTFLQDLQNGLLGAVSWDL